MTFSVQPWQKHDLRAVREITWTTWQSAYAPFIPADNLKTYFGAHYSLRALRAVYADPFVDGFIGTTECGPAGYLRTRYVGDEHRFYVTSLYILPEHQGRGLGGKLLAAAEARALRYGVDAVWLGVMARNKRALAWYRRRGFRFIRKEPFALAATTVEHRIGYRKMNAAAARVPPP
ncbi:MAG: GNAT family N-acetyltransferase [Syntrophales bacterium]|jgi:ribosomal protein S18 acetylase RimI-like enzyme|nr:GNAT family N-acetyltransferase [Syntrophales bacterium]MDD4339296.1 GNAT family N-acetyltransferase [Syntrophales bacterium]HOG08401.1 GNAT family N-acetyltransferase [Syntrophales bacterium]HPB70329.1 GNAT family N-acetyltransferase [Syntrophales bacterium]HQN26008.1 GNAT family N-acetyltransferase [Syntrophales bacterium]